MSMRHDEIGEQQGREKDAETQDPPDLLGMGAPGFHLLLDNGLTVVIFASQEYFPALGIKQGKVGAAIPANLVFGNVHGAAFKALDVKVHGCSMG
jgi:hypothetical protein